MNTVLEWYRNGGPVMNAILLVAVIGLAVFLERFYTIVIRSKINGRAFIERVIQLVRAGKTGRISDRPGSDDGALSRHEARHRCYGADSAGIGQRKRRAL